MGSSGGGGSGKVDYPEYLKNLHHEMLNQTDANSLGFSMFELLNDANDNSPYATAISYTGRTVVGTAPLTVAQALAEILSNDFDEFASFQSNIANIKQDVDNIFSLAVITNTIAKALQSAEPEYQKMLQTYDSLELAKGGAFSSSRIIGRAQVLDAKMRAVLAENLNILSASILQLGERKISDVLAVTEAQVQTLKLTRTAYTTAIEICKLNILNEREYFEQEEFYAKYGAHWKFECLQAGFNAIPATHGKKKTFYESPDAPKWATTAMTIAGLGVGDPIGPYLVQKNKRFRVAMYAAGQGAASGAATGAMFGGVGAIPGLIIGGVSSFVMSYSSYSEGEWR